MTATKLKMCFFLRIGSEFWGEALVGKRISLVSKLAKAGKIDLLTTEGAVSITYNDEELLGIEFWDVIDNVNPIPNDLLAGKQRNIILPFQSFGITLIPQGKDLSYHAKSASPTRVWNMKRTLPRFICARMDRNVFPLR